MLSHEEVLERVLSRVSDKVAESVRDTVAAAVQKELSSTMTKVMVESEFYKQVNEEMRTGLRGIYQIANSSALDDTATPDGGETQKLFSDATKQIEEIMQTTLQATENIMETVEQLLERQADAVNLIAGIEAGVADSAAVQKLAEYNNDLAGALTKIITELSFQDLTGQRLKKVVSAIGSIRETVFDLYVSTGLMMKTREERPEEDINQIAEESRRKVEEIKNSELKGPVMDASQANVDDLLASLGL